MPSVHRSAVLGYSACPDIYLSGRPEYPVETDSWLLNDLGLREGHTALDLGAGTGKSQNGFWPPEQMRAIDPVPALLERLKRQYVDLEVRSGSAEAIPSEDATFDVVVCAQSFHWFDAEEAVVEIHRVLNLGAG